VRHIDPDLLALLALGETATGDTGRHLAACPDCQAELRELTAVVISARGGLDAGPLEEPPAGLWPRIAAAARVDPLPGPAQAPSGLAPASAGADSPAALVGGTPVPDALVPAARPVPGSRPPVAGGPGHAARTPWWRRHPLTAALAGLVVGLIIGAAGAAGIHQLTAQPASHVVASIPLRPLAEFPQWREASGTAVMAESPAGRQLTVALHAPHKRGFYEVWLLARDGTSMISLGDLGPGHTGKFTMPPGVDLRNYSRIDVSLQPFNGSTLHSKTSVVRGSLP
jgi:Anti-sigma-K factor rskA